MKRGALEVGIESSLSHEETLLSVDAGFLSSFYPLGLLIFMPGFTKP